MSRHSSLPNREPEWLCLIRLPSEMLPPDVPRRGWPLLRCNNAKYLGCYPIRSTGGSLKGQTVSLSFCFLIYGIFVVSAAAQPGKTQALKGVCQRLNPRPCAVLLHWLTVAGMTMTLCHYYFDTKMKKSHILPSSLQCYYPTLTTFQILLFHLRLSFT